MRSASPWGATLPPGNTGRCLETPLTVTAGSCEVFRYLVSGGRGAAKRCRRQAPTKSSPAPNISSPQLKKPTLDCNTRGLSDPASIRREVNLGEGRSASLYPPPAGPCLPARSTPPVCPHPCGELSGVQLGPVLGFTLKTVIGRCCFNLHLTPLPTPPDPDPLTISLNWFRVWEENQGVSLAS